MNIFVSNLNLNVDNDDLREIFEPYGEVLTAHVIYDKETGNSKGFGFVEMLHDENGQIAIDNLNRKEYKSRIMKVAIARERKEEIIYINYCLPPSEREYLETLKRHRSFRHLNKLYKVTYKDKYGKICIKWSEWENLEQEERVFYNSH